MFENIIGAPFGSCCGFWDCMQSRWNKHEVVAVDLLGGSGSHEIADNGSGTTPSTAVGAKTVTWLQEVLHDVKEFREYNRNIDNSHEASSLANNSGSILQKLKDDLGVELSDAAKDLRSIRNEEQVDFGIFPADAPSILDARRELIVEKIDAMADAIQDNNAIKNMKAMTAKSLDELAKEHQIA